MKRILAALICLAAMPVFADSPETIKLIHSKTKDAIIEICKDKMKMNTPACTCLGEKAQSSLNDTTLAACKIDDKECNTKEIERAMFQALEKESIADCSKKS